MAQLRCAVFTLNNYTEAEEEDLINYQYRYLIIGKEIGKNGTPHLQGYIEFESRKYFTTLKKFNPNIHWEKRMGSQLQAIEYCKKEGNFKEYGNRRIQGQRTDLQYFKELAMKEGMKAVVEEGNFQQIKTCELYLKYKEPVRDFKPEVIWIHGESETGKSEYANQFENAYWKDESKWWDGYDNHETIVIDDFDTSFMKFKPLLRLLDRYPLRVQTKGASRQMLAKRIVITSIHSPKDIHNAYLDYNSLREPYHQLHRRITKIIKTERKVPEVGVILCPTSDLIEEI